MAPSYHNSWACVSDYVFKSLTQPLDQAKNGDEQSWKQKFHVANGKAQHALMNSPVFFFLRRQGERGFLFFPPVPHVFPSMSQRVPPQDVPNMVYPKFNSHVYKPKKVTNRQHICFYLATWGPKKCFYLWSAQSSEVLVMGQPI